MNNKVMIQNSAQDFTNYMNLNEKRFEMAVERLEAQLEVLNAQKAIKDDALGVLYKSIEKIIAAFASTGRDYYVMRDTLQYYERAKEALKEDKK